MFKFAVSIRAAPNPTLLRLIFVPELATLVIMEPTEESRGVNLHSLLESGRFSDLKLSCDGHEFAVHKAILCVQSRVISAECEGNFQVGSVRRNIERLFSDLV